MRIKKTKRFRKWQKRDIERGKERKRKRERERERERKRGRERERERERERGNKRGRIGKKWKKYRHAVEE